MGDVELVIKIPEELLSEIDDENYQSVISWYDTSLYCAIKDGIPLSKGHGKLIDVDDIRIVELEDSLHIIRHEKGDDIDVYIDAPTVIEADNQDYEKNEVEK